MSSAVGISSTEALSAKQKGLQVPPWVVILLSGLYRGSAVLAGLFVSVYLWVNSNDFPLLFRYHLILYITTPVVFLLAGWYSQARDRLHVYRFGLFLHLAYYGTLLFLQERATLYAEWLGVALGVTWGIYFAGANPFNFDVAMKGRREHYFGTLQTVTGLFSLLAPLIGGLLIRSADTPAEGYLYVFGVICLLCLSCFALSFFVPPDNERRPYRIMRALFPGDDQRDWRLIQIATVAQGGMEDILNFLLGLLLYIETQNELSVGGFASFQSVAGIITSYLCGRFIVPSTRRRSMLISTIMLVCAGAIIAWRLNLATLVLFGFLRSIAGPLFGISNFSLRYETILKCAEEPAQRIEYISAHEVPLAMGRIITMLLLMILYTWLSGNTIALRAIIFCLCSMRIIVFFVLSRTSGIRYPDAS